MDSQSSTGGEVKRDFGVFVFAGKYFGKLNVPAKWNIFILLIDSCRPDRFLKTCQVWRN